MEEISDEGLIIVESSLGNGKIYARFTDLTLRFCEISEGFEVSSDFLLKPLRMCC